jgi:hypothetical protein
MLAANLKYDLSFTFQLIVHCGLLFFLFLWFLLSQHSADKVAEVYHEQTAQRSGILEMKRAMRNLKDKINDTAGLPESFVKQVTALEGNLRFISPTNSNEAYDLERQFVNIINDISYAISDFSMNESAIESNLKKVERIYNNRKSVYSN